MTLRLAIVLACAFVAGVVAGVLVGGRARAECLVTAADVLKLADQIERGLPASSLPCRVVE